MIRILFTSSVLLFSSVYSFTNCPLNFNFDELLNKCVYYQTQTFDQSSAVSYCQTFRADSHLPSIHNGFQNNYFSKAASTQNMQNLIWIGLRITNGSISWEDGSSIDYTNWSKGVNITGIKSACVAMGLGDGAWYVQDCSRQWQVACFGRQQVHICEEDKGWSTMNENCFKASDTVMSKSEMLSYCQNQNGDLASIHSQEEQTFVQTIMEDNTGPHVTGLCYSVSTGWGWTDNSEMDYDLLHGKSSNRTGDCAAVFKTNTGIAPSIVNANSIKYRCICRKDAFI